MNRKSQSQTFIPPLQYPGSWKIMGRGKGFLLTFENSSRVRKDFNNFPSQQSSRFQKRRANGTETRPLHGCCRTRPSDPGDGVAEPGSIPVGWRNPRRWLLSLRPPRRGRRSNRLPRRPRSASEKAPPPKGPTRHFRG